MIKVTSLLMIAAGIWFLASAATEDGLLPSGHGVGRTSEVVFGAAFVLFGAFRVWKGRR